MRQEKKKNSSKSDDRQTENLMLFPEVAFLWLTSHNSRIVSVVPKIKRSASYTQYGSFAVDYYGWTNIRMNDCNYGAMGQYAICHDL